MVNGHRCVLTVALKGRAIPFASSNTVRFEQNRCFDSMCIALFPYCFCFTIGDQQVLFVVLNQFLFPHYKKLWWF